MDYTTSEKSKVLVRKDISSYSGTIFVCYILDVGVEAKYILFRDLCVQYHRGYFKSEMAFEIESFCCVVDEVSVKAGSYVAFTKSALISFYGVLVSYMAIVVQSF